MAFADYYSLFDLFSKRSSFELQTKTHMCADGTSVLSEYFRIYYVCNCSIQPQSSQQVRPPPLLLYVGNFSVAFFAHT